ncbi:patatin family protein, partial [Ruminococcaceae bacterium OttesenSCG-928-D13]|nr:patatin family protein [Ruminococcaceae bacterium OttesenSCG-928-D13]
YLDGGVAAPIPIDKALAEGADRLVVVLTRPRGFVKKPQHMSGVFKAVYRNYPNMVRAIARRHEVYNKTLERLWQLEKDGVAIVAAPPLALAVDRFGKNRDELINAFSIGRVVGQAELKKL